MILLTACATEPSNIASVCPAVVEYSKDFMASAADAYIALPKDSPLRKLVDDYKVERAQLRACNAIK